MAMPSPAWRHFRGPHHRNHGIVFSMTFIYWSVVLCAVLQILGPVTPVQSAIFHKSFIARNHVEEGDGEAKLHRNLSLYPAWKSSPRSRSPGWRKTGIRFLTKVKWSDETDDGDEFQIASSDFHIVELEPEDGSQDINGGFSVPETLRIHLMRKAPVVNSQLRVIVKDGNSEEEWHPSEGSLSNCHFVGQVTSSSPSRNLRKSESGLAVLSACSPSKGFSGLILMEDGRQWYIEPSALQGNHVRRKRDASLPYDSIEHMLLPHADLAGRLAEHISDVLRVPLPQLEEAARLAATDAEARRSIRSGWDDDYEESLQGESSILTPFLHSGATLPLVGRNGNAGGKVQSKVNLAKRLSASGSASSKKVPATTLLTPLEDTLESSSSGSGTTSASQEKRESPAAYVVEIAVFTDEELYNKMKAKFTDDTTAQLKEYATAMVNMMDVMYQHATLGVDLRFRLVYMEVMKRKPTSLKTNGGKAKAYLSSFCDYAGEKNVNSAQWDHALLLTGVDLHEEGVKTTAGLAWAGTMCFRYYSCSISEGLNFASAYITTHEIGHSLGMEHDGVGISDSCDSTKFIMSPTTGPGKVTWSACSSSNLQDFIKYGTSELRGKTSNSRMISRPICLEELVARSKKSLTDSESDVKLPGEKYDANFQCSLGMGSFFKPHFERHKAPFDNICWILYCGNGTHAISTHPALEGTPCDRKKYCRSGQCVKRPET